MSKDVKVVELGRSRLGKIRNTRQGILYHISKSQGTKR